MKISIGTVREVSGGQLMTASEIAKAGGWSANDTNAFMANIVVDDAEGSGGAVHGKAGGPRIRAADGACGVLL